MLQKSAYSTIKKKKKSDEDQEMEQNVIVKYANQLKSYAKEKVIARTKSDL